MAVAEVSTTKLLLPITRCSNQVFDRTKCGAVIYQSEEREEHTFVLEKNILNKNDCEQDCEDGECNDFWGVRYIPSGQVTNLCILNKREIGILGQLHSLVLKPYLALKEDVKREWKEMRIDIQAV